MHIIASFEVTTHPLYAKIVCHLRWIKEKYRMCLFIHSYPHSILMILRGVGERGYFVHVRSLSGP